MNGLLVIDKPSGMTSHDVVNRVRRLTAEKSIGHLGTLDPMVTGVLPLLLGRYTRLAQFFTHTNKTYEGRMRFGFATDTYDREGAPATPPTSVNFSREQLLAEAARFRGVVQQTPPPYSAKKVNGKPAYALARAGEVVSLKPVAIDILEFTITEFQGDEAAFFMTVSAGGYVRSVAHDLGKALGCGAHLSQLRRTRAGDFAEQDAVTLEQLETLGPGLELKLLHARNLLPEMPSVTADERTLGRLRNGSQINLPEFSDSSLVKIFEGQRHLVAIGRRVAGTLFQPDVVIG